MNFRIVLPRTKWWRCLEDIAECLRGALRTAGHEADLTQNFAGGYTGAPCEIAIGAHRESVTLPDYPVVVYQTEVPGSAAFPASYSDKLKRALCVWDSAPGYGTGQAVVEPGFTDQRDVMIVGPKDIPLLFFGSMTDRRVEILTRLHKAGLGLECHFGVFGSERNALIDRAQVVVDIKQRDTDPNDKTRTFFLDSRGACVLTENDENPDRALSPIGIVEQCRSLLTFPDRRTRHIESRRAELKPTDVTAGIAALEKSLAPKAGAMRPRLTYEFQ